MKEPTAISSFLPTSEPAVRFWLTALIGSSVLVLVLMLLLGMASIEWLLVLLLFMMGMVRWSGNAIAVFVIISLVIFLSTQFGRPSQLSVGEALLAGAVLVYSGIHFRLWQAVQRARRVGADAIGTPYASSASRLWSELLAIVGVAMASALLAQMAIGYLYVGRAVYRDFGMPAILAQFLCGVLVVGGVALLLVAIVRTLNRRTWNRLEAEMALNEETYGLLLVELRRLTRRSRRR